VYDAFKLDDKVAIVTGSGEGVGFEMARALRDSGTRVVLAELDPDLAAAAGEELGVDYVALDVTDSSAVEAAFRDIAEKNGGLDIVVNNAGTVLNVAAEDETDEGWRTVMNVNLDGVFWCCRAAGRIKLPQRRGSIINTASISSQVANHPQKQASYNTSKAGGVTLTKCLAAEWADHGVRVNCISPGYTGTPLLKVVEERNPVWYQTWIDGIPLGRVAEPREMAPAVVFLASNAASYVTGSNLIVDGGYALY